MKRPNPFGERKNPFSDAPLSLVKIPDAPQELEKYKPFFKNVPDTPTPPRPKRSPGKGSAHRTEVSDPGPAFR